MTDGSAVSTWLDTEARLMTSRRIHRRALLAGMAAVPLGLSFGEAHGRQTPSSPANGDDLIAITITATDVVFAMPERVPAGHIAMSLVNAGQQPHAAQLLRHEEGVLLPDIMAALRQDGLGSLEPLVSLAGGPGHVAPGARQTVIQELTPGQYTVICTVIGDRGVPHAITRLPHRFEVTDEDVTLPVTEIVMSGLQQEIPAAQQLWTRSNAGSAPHAEVRMVDFGFEGLPNVISTGQHLWKVTSEGAEPHELGLRLLDDGVTADMVAGMLQELGTGTPVADAATGTIEMLADLPVSPAGGIQAMASGNSGWVVVDLDPGEYVAVSLVPSVANQGQLQAQLGMVQGFSVSAL